jgi:hypothetical protein
MYSVSESCNPAFVFVHALLVLFMQSGNGVRLTLSNFNLTYNSNFNALGIQGQTTYFFAGSLQASVSSVCMQSQHCPLAP